MNIKSPSEQILLSENAELHARLEKAEETIRTLRVMQDLKTALDEHAIVAITDPQGKITFANDRFCAISKYAREELIGQDHRIVNSGFHPPEFIRDLWTTITRGRVWHGEIRNRAKDGSIYWMDTTIVPLLNEDGKPRQYVVIRFDITARKRVEMELRDSEQRMRLATEATAVGIWEWDVNTDQIRWDAQMFRIYGITPTKDGLVDYSTWRGAVLPEDFPQQEEVLQDTVRRLGHSSREFRIRRPGESECRHIQAVEAVRTNTQGKTEWVVGTNLDVTERKQVEEQICILNQDLDARVVERTSELQAAINALETEIAQRQRLEHEILEISEREQSRVGQDLHDGLCQDLAGISFLAKALKQNLEHERLPSAEAAAAAETISNLLRDTLKGAHGLATGMYPVDIEETGLVCALEKLAADTAQRFQIACKFKCARAGHVCGRRASAHVFRITQEAMSNAIRHGGAKLVLITLAGAGQQLILKIEDNGQGLLKDLKRTGMGLKTMHYRARSIGGRLEIRQRRRHGLSVVCTFQNQQGTEA